MFVESIFLNILAVLFLIAISVHVKNAYALAQKQKLSAVKLNAYLTYWKSMIDASGISTYFYADERIQSLQHALIRAKYTNHWAEVSKVKSAIHQELEKSFPEDQNDPNENESIQTVIDFVEALPGGLDFLSRKISAESQNLLDGKTFVRDDEASSLGYSYAYTAVSIKMNATHCMGDLMLVVALIYSKPEKFRSQIKTAWLDCLWKALLVLAEIDILSSKVRQLENRTVLRMAWRNFWGRSC